MASTNFAVMTWASRLGVAMPLGMICRRHGRDAHHRHAFLAITGRTGVFGPDMALHLHDGRDVIELFGDLFTDAVQAGPAGADLLVLGQIVDDFDARQMVRQRLAPTLGSGVSRDLDYGHFRRLRLCDPDQGQRQNALEEILGFLGLGSIQGGLQQSHAVLEMVDLLVVIPDKMFELPDVVRQVFDIAHAFIYIRNSLK